MNPFDSKSGSVSSSDEESTDGKSASLSRRSSAQWKLHGLPDRVDGLTFIDVGCWEGHICAEAVTRGASTVLGVDYCTCPDLATAMATFGFQFIQLDVLSEKALQLPEFDVVHCAGVLYHVENPLSLLYRLRKLCRLGGTLYLETSYAIGPVEQQPLMVFHPGTSLDDNPSNWWSPNEACLREMLALIGLIDIAVTFKNEPKTRRAEFRMGRIGIRGCIGNIPTAGLLKMLPRRPSLMSSASGLGNRS
jgi:SAM-dependent methyltransferase